MALALRFEAWMGKICPAVKGRVIAIAGKVLRALLQVSAYATEDGLTLGQPPLCRKVERNHGDRRAVVGSGAGRCGGDHRRHGLPDGDCRANYRRRGRLRSGGQG